MMNAIIFVTSTSLLSILFAASSVDGFDSYQNPPCFFNDLEEPFGVYPPVKFPIENIRVWIQSLRSVLKKRLNEMEDLCKPSEDYSFISKKLDAMKIPQTLMFRTIFPDQIDLLETMHEQYDMLNTLALYLVQTRRRSKDFTASDSLKSILENVYKVMCEMKQILRLNYRYTKAKVPSGKLSNGFIEYVKYTEWQTISVCQQQRVEYVVVHDLEKLILYLDQFYSNGDAPLLKSVFFR